MNSCYTDWTRSEVNVDNIGKYMTGPFNQERLYITPFEQIDQITLSKGEEIIGVFGGSGRLRCDIEDCSECIADSKQNITYCAKCSERFTLVDRACQKCDQYDSECI